MIENDVVFFLLLLLEEGPESGRRTDGFMDDEVYGIKLVSVSDGEEDLWRSYDTWRESLSQQKLTFFARVDLWNNDLIDILMCVCFFCLLHLTRRMLEPCPAWSRM